MCSGEYLDFFQEILCKCRVLVGGRWYYSSVGEYHPKICRLPYFLKFPKKNSCVFPKVLGGGATSSCTLLGVTILPPHSRSLTYPIFFLQLNEVNAGCFSGGLGSRKKKTRSNPEVLSTASGTVFVAKEFLVSCLEGAGSLSYEFLIKSAGANIWN